MKIYQHLQKRTKRRVYLNLARKAAGRALMARATAGSIAAKSNSLIQGIRNQSFERPTGKVIVINSDTREQKYIDASELPHHGFESKEAFVANKKIAVAKATIEATKAAVPFLAEYTKHSNEFSRCKRLAG